VEVPVAEDVRLVAGGLHLCGMGKCGKEEESSAARMNNNGAGEGFYSHDKRWAYTHGTHLRLPMLRSDALLRRCAKLLPVQLFNAGGEATGEWRQQSIDAVADSGPRGESRA
jgi:hypothetical protein